MKVIALGRKRVIALLMTLLLLSLIYLLGWSSIFAVSEVKIKTSDDSNKSLISSQLSSSSLGLEIGAPLARVNTRAIARLLREQDWIGAVTVDRSWLGGRVTVDVRERIPLMSVERSARLLGISALDTKRGAEFVNEEGAIFTLPGELSKKYQELPRLVLDSDRLEDRRSALALFQAIEKEFPTQRITVSALSTLSSLSQWQAPATSEGEGQAAPRGLERPIEIRWGSMEKIEIKISVARELLKMKENRNLLLLDLNNPSLPIVKK